MSAAKAETEWRDGGALYSAELRHRQTADRSEVKGGPRNVVRDQLVRAEETLGTGAAVGLDKDVADYREID